jgi:hypothetical protein
MKTTTLNFADLLPTCNQLQASLFYWRYSAPGIWPVDELEDEDLKTFVADIYALAHTCRCMHMPVMAPNRKPYVYHETQWLERRELVILTRELLWCCDLDLVYEYRQPDLPEYEAVRLLEQTHAQLIGAVYGDRPGMETVAADEIRFGRQA